MKTTTPIQWSTRRLLGVLVAFVLTVGGVSSAAVADESSQTVTVKPHVEQTDNGLAGGASKTYEKKSTIEASASNAKEGDLGGTELKNGQTVGKGEIGAHQEGAIQSEFGDVKGKVDAGASGEVKVGDNGVEASGQIGLAAELEAVSKQFAAGDENVGASIQGSAKVEAMLGAEGKIGAYIDEHGITIGGEASAGAFVSAQAQISFEAHVFGLSTTVKLYAEAHAGVMAHGEAVVTIGFDGKIKFELGAGISVGIGASAGIEFEVDASALIEKLGLKDLAELIEWIDEFQKDPQATIDQLIDDTKNAMIDQAKQAVEEKVNNLINFLTPSIEQLPEGDSENQIDPLPTPDQPPPPAWSPIDVNDGTPGSGSRNYKRAYGNPTK